MSSSLVQQLDVGDDKFFNFSSLFTPIKVLGQGSFGKVIHAVDNATGEELAIKVIQKKKVGDECIDKVKEEARILEKLNHPNVVMFKKVCETDTRILIAMELVRGGSLADLIKSKKKSTETTTTTTTTTKGTATTTAAASTSISEKDVSTIIRSIMKGLAYIHAKNIVHRDLKPENILIGDTSNFESVKIADFGLSSVFSLWTTSGLTEQCGTLLYMAPEFFASRTYSKQIDIWSCGITMYYLLDKGRHPFYEPTIDDSESFKAKLAKPKWRYPSTFSKLARSLLQKLGLNNAMDRYSAIQALQHPFLTQNINGQIPMTLNEQLTCISTQDSFTEKLKAILFLEMLKAFGRSKQIDQVSESGCVDVGGDVVASTQKQGRIESLRDSARSPDLSDQADRQPFGNRRLKTRHSCSLFTIDSNQGNSISILQTEGRNEVSCTDVVTGATGKANSMHQSQLPLPQFMKKQQPQLQQHHQSQSLSQHLQDAYVSTSGQNNLEDRQTQQQQQQQALGILQDKRKRASFTIKRQRSFNQDFTLPTFQSTKPARKRYSAILPETDYSDSSVHRVSVEDSCAVAAAPSTVGGTHTSQRAHQKQLSIQQALLQVGAVQRTRSTAQNTNNSQSINNNNNNTSNTISSHLKKKELTGLPQYQQQQQQQPQPQLGATTHNGNSTSATADDNKAMQIQAIIQNQIRLRSAFQNFQEPPTLQSQLQQEQQVLQQFSSKQIPQTTITTTITTNPVAVITTTVNSNDRRISISQNKLQGLLTGINKRDPEADTRESAVATSTTAGRVYAQENQNNQFGIGGSFTPIITRGKKGTTTTTTTTTSNMNQNFSSVPIAQKENTNGAPVNASIDCTNSGTGGLLKKPPLRNSLHANSSSSNVNITSTNENALGKGQKLVAAAMAGPTQFAEIFARNRIPLRNSEHAFSKKQSMSLPKDDPQIPQTRSGSSGVRTLVISSQQNQKFLQLPQQTAQLLAREEERNPPANKKRTDEEEQQGAGGEKGINSIPGARIRTDYRDTQEARQQQQQEVVGGGTRAACENQYSTISHQQSQSKVVKGYLLSTQSRQNHLLWKKFNL